MPTFQKVKFKSFVQLQRGFDLPQQDRVDGKYPIIASTSITGRHNTFKVKAPCVTTGRSGTLGEVLYINEKCWPLNTTLWVKDFKNNNPKFVYYKLKTMDLKKFNVGSGVPTLNRNHINEINIEIPDIKTQTRIARVLSAYDDLIENNEKRIKVLEQMAQLLYTEWFVKFEFPISLCHPEAPAEGSQGYKSSGGKMLDTHTEYGKIPEGWEVKKLGDIVSAQYGYTASAVNNNACPKYLRGTDINKTSFIDWHYVPNCEISDADFKKYKVKKGGVFIIRMADPGKIGMCEREINAVFASYLMRLNIKGDITPYYLYYFVNSERYQKFILGASNGTTRKSINSQQVGAINIIIPPQDILNNFELRIGAFRETLNNLIQQNNFLSQTRDLLIPQLVTGKREVK